MCITKNIKTIAIRTLKKERNPVAVAGVAHFELYCFKKLPMIK